MKRIWHHVKTYIFRGFLAIIPLMLSFFAIQFLYVVIDKRVTGLVGKYFGVIIPGVGLLIVVVVLYFVGLIASNLLGRQLFNLIENITNRIPLIRTTYQIGKQLSTTLLLPEGQVFKRAVLVDYLKPGIWVVGFVTGMIIDQSNDNRKMLKVFIPTPPNPTSGTMVLVHESQTRDPGWTIDEAIRTVVSGGIIGPEWVR
jgi:uncharacterized membrane protein